METEWVYGLIFTAYVACFIFIASYMMVRKKRNEKNNIISHQAKNPCQKEEIIDTSEEAENSEIKENLETKKTK